MSDKHKLPPLLLFKNAIFNEILVILVLWLIYIIKNIICGMDKVWFLDMYLHFLERKHDFINLTTITFIPLNVSLLE